MANYFQLISLETKESVSLSKVDTEICTEVLNCAVHPKYYGGTVFNWFDSIGFMLATGLTLEDGENSVRNHYNLSNGWGSDLPIINKIIDYLQSKYTTQSWTR